MAYPNKVYIYSEKATNFWEIFTLFWSYVEPVKSEVKISQNFVPFSEYTIFDMFANEWLNRLAKFVTISAKILSLFL